MYKCIDCGHIFEYGEERIIKEAHGEETECCPLCNGDFEETVECQKCSSAHLKNELVGGVCEECVSEAIADYDFCFKIGAEYPEPIKINSAILSVLDESKIEDILKSYIRKNSISMTPFYEQDEGWLAEQIVKKGVK